MKAKRMKCPYPLVLIEFRDATQPDNGWVTVEEYELPADSVCQSVGFIIRENKHEVALAQTITDYHDELTPQVIGVFRIPKSAIVRTIKL